MDTRVESVYCFIARFLFRGRSSWTDALWPALLRSASLRSTGRLFFLQVCECLVGQFLERFHLIAREQVERLPSFVVQLYALAWHVSVDMLTMPFCAARPNARVSWRRGEA